MRKNFLIRQHRSYSSQTKAIKSLVCHLNPSGKHQEVEKMSGSTWKMARACVWKMGHRWSSLTRSVWGAKFHVFINTEAHHPPLPSTIYPLIQPWGTSARHPDSLPSKGGDKNVTPSPAWSSLWHSFGQLVSVKGMIQARQASAASSVRYHF